MNSEAKPRTARRPSPVTDHIEAIFKNVYSALWSGTSPQTALKNAQSQINKALQTF